ncbi:Secreted protein [Colletotrichum scovillei]|uniref:Secreted protein n=1 Tax=Colletotrichum scovillei TaxID=1209932 RepID=A0A9P7R158_9PEZI|nr:Secreted protein [Colletotrichum scovillei]KAG7052465.1 Secreted protein [Colletotrichum scovillei]KAG7064755.1 Secreted protein [Colletotrichum scovillei]
MRTRHCISLDLAVGAANDDTPLILVPRLTIDPLAVGLADLDDMIRTVSNHTERVKLAGILLGDVARESGAVKVVSLVDGRRGKLEVEVKVFRVIGVDDLKLRKNLLDRSSKNQLRAPGGSLDLPLRNDDAETIDRGLKLRGLLLAGESRNLIQIISKGP